MSRSPAELGALRKRLRRERAEHDRHDRHDRRDERDKRDDEDGAGRPTAGRVALAGLAILAIAVAVAVLSLPRILGGARETTFDASNPPAELALCREYILTGPHASPGADALVVDAVPGQPVRLPSGSECPLILEVRAPDGTFIQYVGAEEPS